jgi:hypothetical protein
VPFAAPWSVGTIVGSPFPQPQVPTPAQALFFPQSQFIATVAQFKPAYSFQWTLSIQREFGRGWQLQVDYIGNATRHDPIGSTFDPATFIPGVWGAGGTGCAGIVTTGPAAVKVGAAGTNCSTTGNQTSRFLLTQQNPTGVTGSGSASGGNQYLGGGAGSIIVGDEGTANYNGMVASINHRLSSTFSLLGNWTWSKCLNIYDAQGDYAGTATENINNIALDYGPCGSDFRHIENVSLVVRSNFSNHLNGVEKMLANGWELAPLIRIQSGAPFTVTAGQDNSLTDIGNDRPNLVPGVSPYAEVKFKNATGVANREYLNPAAFQQVWQTVGCASATANACPALGTYGNISRDSFRGPKQLNFDAQISRAFPIHESLTTTLRLEAFNVLNHPDFNIPTGGTTGTPGGTTGGAAVLTSSTFGQISTTTNQARVFQGSIKITF